MVTPSLLFSLLLVFGLLAIGLRRGTPARAY
ncbi:hypothetical protein HBN54_001746 [Hymenobacter sp. 1B]|uniref:Uncharacterized protein n=1 Tax=Hymenobacter artigasi TaxID=2719616 RepID=A0ABX1HJM0_9BACT|nr:hypothetical protein [Hymenobacter artigasi]